MGNHLRIGGWACNIQFLLVPEIWRILVSVKTSLNKQEIADLHYRATLETPASYPRQIPAGLL